MSTCRRWTLGCIQVPKTRRARRGTTCRGACGGSWGVSRARGPILVWIHLWRSHCRLHTRVGCRSDRFCSYLQKESTPTIYWLLVMLWQFGFCFAVCCGMPVRVTGFDLSQVAEHIKLSSVNSSQHCVFPLTVWPHATSQRRVGITQETKLERTCESAAYIEFWRLCEWLSWVVTWKVETCLRGEQAQLFI